MFRRATKVLKQSITRYINKLQYSVGPHWTFIIHIFYYILILLFDIRVCNKYLAISPYIFRFVSNCTNVTMTIVSHRSANEISQCFV